MNRIAKYEEEHSMNVIEEMIRGLKEDYQNNLIETRMFVESYNRSHSYTDFEIIRNLRAERTRIEHDLNRWLDTKNCAHVRRSQRNIN